MIKTINWLGKTPEIIKDMNKEDFIVYFTYIYEYYFDNNIEKVYGKMENYIKELYDKIYEKEGALPNEKIWWVLILSILKESAGIQNFIYLKNLIDKIEDNIKDISVQELEDYCNEINCVFIVEGIKTIVVRPFEMEMLCGKETLKINKFDLYMDMKSDVLNILNKYISEDDLNMEYINTMFLSDKKKTAKYSPIITQYAEFLFSYFKTVYEQITEIMSAEQKSTIIIDAFFEVTTNPHSKVENLKKELIKLFTAKIE